MSITCVVLRSRRPINRTLVRLPLRCLRLGLALLFCGVDTPIALTQVVDLTPPPGAGSFGAQEDYPALPRVALPEISANDGDPLLGHVERASAVSRAPSPPVQMVESIQGLETAPETPVIESNGAATPNVVAVPQASSSQPPEPWWAESVAAPIRANGSSISIDLDQLFLLSATHSGRVQAIAQTPWINQTQVEQAKAAFDPTVFGSSRFDSTSEPVENTLTTGGANRLQDHVLGMDAGLRGRNYAGTTYSMGQRLGHKNSNSNFFVPNDQGSSRMFANLTHPLLRGRKIDPARSLVITAQFQTQAAQADYQDAIQKQLFQVADTYWLLYTERASLLQRQRHVVRAQQIADLLQHRASLDSSQSQILRARAAVTNRTAEIVQADARIRNLESRLCALTNAPELCAESRHEFLPVQPAGLLPISFDMQEEVEGALERRPELKKLAHKLSLARVRLRLAQDQTRPTLNLVAEGYVAGLQGDSDIFGAWTDQFSTGRPGYAAGLVYERPIRNREAKAAIQQWQHEIARLIHLTIEAKGNIQAEVETALRNVEASKLAAESRWQSQLAATAEVEYLNDRWQSLGNDPRFGQLQLDDLLRSQDRLLQEEQSLLQALVQYNRALLEVQRATGMLVRFAH